MPFTNFSGPLSVGPQQFTTFAGTSPNIGYPILQQPFTNAVAVSTTTTAAVTNNYQVNLPQSAQISNFQIDVVTAWDSNTSATLKIGTTSGGTDFVSSIDLKTQTGRISLSPTTAQLNLWKNIGTNTAIVATVVSTGTATTGTAYIQVHYVMTT